MTTTTFSLPGFPGSSVVKSMPASAGDVGSILVEMGMATHSSILAWRIPWTEGSGGLQFVRLRRVNLVRIQWLNSGNNIVTSFPILSLSVAASP